MKADPPDVPGDPVAEALACLRRVQRKGIRNIYDVQEVGRVVRDTSAAPAADATTRATERVKPKIKGAAVTEAVTMPKELAAVRDTVAACTECDLHGSRTNTVFGVGNPKTKALFIGEAPGADEDRQGEPFVGRSGQLLTKILAAIDLKREDVYITNILKCRPPANRDPQESEVRCCEKYLVRQIELIKPKVICALGRVSAQWLLQTNAPLGTLRTGEYYYEGVRVLATYHPAALLRNPNFKKPAWEDFKKLRAMLDDV